MLGETLQAFMEPGFAESCGETETRSPRPWIHVPESKWGLSRSTLSLEEIHVPESKWGLSLAAWAKETIEV